MEPKLSGYELSRRWFDFCFENPNKIKPIHTAIYFFAVEHCNRLGWKKKFGFPTTMAMEALGIRSYNTYIEAFNELIEFGFIHLIEKSRNQYSSNIIALSNFDEALDEALDKALMKHNQKQHESTIQSTGESTCSIDKQVNHITIKPSNHINYLPAFEHVWELYGRKGSKKQAYDEWKKLSQADKDTLLDHVPRYVEANEAEPQYMKDFERYIKHQTFHSAIIERPRRNIFSGSL